MSTTTAIPAAPAGVEALSGLPQAVFVACLGDIFEHSPWVPERAWAARPFASIDALHAAMVAVVDQAAEAEQLALICAHPELAGREAAAGTLTSASTGEQRGAGLDQCSTAELQRLRSLNAAYRAHFGFPFVIAVKGLSRYQIMDALEARLANDRATEFRACLAQIARIARFRLDALLGPAT
jgi:2-oxo-4-hydroxy-4-carboxy-5-ureidoimidazoline decarboxylase